MKKNNKSPYHDPPVKLRAEVIEQKINKNNQKVKQSSSQDQSSQNEYSQYDEQIQQFANQFYDTAVKKAEEEKKQINQDNQLKDQRQRIDIKNNKKSKKTKQYEKIQQRLKQLKNNNLDWQMIMFKKKDNKKLKQIAQFLSRKHKEKRDFKKKLFKIKSSQKQRLKIQEQMRKKKQEEQHMKRMKQIRKISLQIKKKVNKNKIQAEDKLQQIQQFYQKFHQKYQNKNKKIYQLMLINDQKKRNQQIQRQKAYLKERKKMYSQNIRVQDLNQFSRLQSERLKDISKVKQSQKQQKLMDIAEKNKEMRDRIYISYQYQQIQQQETQRVKLRNMANEKLKKIKNYQVYVKENFLPSSGANNNQQEEDQDNVQSLNKFKQQGDDEIVQINGKLYRKVKKIRYLKGQEIGAMYVNMPIPQSESEMKRQGNSYLEQLKHLPKKRHSTSLDLSRVSEDKKISASTVKIQIPKIKRKLGKISLPKNANRYQIENLIKSLKAKDQILNRKQKYFKIHSPTHANPQKDILDENLFDNIEKKINLLGRL